VPEAIVVIDAGTSGLRAVAVTPNGDVATIFSEPWPVFVPEDAAPFGREYDGAGVELALESLLSTAGAAPYHALGLAVTGQREAVAFVDRAGRPALLSPNVDARASAEGMTIDAVRGDDVYSTTGHLPSLLMAPAKMAWLRTHRPAVAASVARCMPLADWIAFALTGEAAMSRTLGVEVGVVDATTGALAAGLLHDLDFDARLLPGVVAEGTIVGRVARGPLAGTPVALAGGDTQCATAGAGATDAGCVGVAAGWSATAQLVTDMPLFDDERRTWTGLHVLPKRWVLESNAGDAGRAWTWTREMLGVDDAEADALAAHAPAGANDVLSVLGPGAMRASSMSAGVGALALPLPIVMSSPARSDVLRATLEGIACAIRVNLEQLEAIRGSVVQRVALGGGMSRSGVFRQIVADVIDRRVEVAPAPQTSALGAAAVAAAGLGLHASLEDAISAMAPHRTCVQPNAGDSAVYEDVYGRWLELSAKLEAMN
jgi:autoinducer 2 (AI-2) kinase